MQKAQPKLSLKLPLMRTQKGTNGLQGTIYYTIYTKKPDRSQAILRSIFERKENLVLQVYATPL